MLHSIDGIGGKCPEEYSQDAGWNWGVGAWGDLFGAERVRGRVAAAVMKTVSFLGVDLGLG